MSVSSNTRRGVIIDSLVSKIIQYEYNIIKLKKAAESLDRLIEVADSSKQTPILHYIIPFIGNAFAISENGFNGRLQYLEKYSAITTSGINIPATLFHIPYDNNDSVVHRPLEMPSPKDSIECVRQLRGLCDICLRGYNTRMALAIKKYHGDRESIRALIITIDSLLERYYLDNQSIDVALGCNFLTRWEEREADESEEVTNLRMIEEDMRVIFTFVPKLNSSLHKLAGEVGALQKLKKIPAHKQEEYISSLPDATYLLHRIVMLMLRLNDLYLEVRKVGRKVYLSNYEHIRDHRFLCLQNNSQALRWSMNEMNELFTLNKRNGALIAGLTRCFGPNIFIQDSKTLLSLTNFANQGVNNIASMLHGLEVFGKNWLLQEVAFRKTYHIQEESLLDFFISVRDQSEIVRYSPTQTAREDRQSSYKPDTRMRVGASISVHGSTKAVPNESSLENSITSLSLNNSFPENASSILGKLPEADNGSSNEARSSASTIPSNQASQLPSERDSTSSSMLEYNSIHQRSSGSTTKASSSPDGRNKIPNASSAAANSVSRKHYGLRSPTGTLKSLHLPSHHRSSQLLRSNNEEKKHMELSSPYGRRIEKDMQTREGPEKLTAHQRFQKRLKDASRSGYILTQNKQPHSSSAHEPISLSDNYCNSEQASSRSLRTDVSDNSSTQKENLGALSSTEETSSLVSRGQSIKRVRFTGVPKYTEAEDAPSRYHNKYFKSIAVVRTPNTTLRKKDRMFQNEESILFRSQIHNEGSNLNSNLSKLRQKLI